LPITALCAACHAAPPEQPPTEQPKQRQQASSVRAGSCVDGPRPARDYDRRGAVVACSHVSGLLMQSGRTAGPDGFRESSAHHSNGIDVPMKRQASLDCVGPTDYHHPVSLLSQARAVAAMPPQPKIDSPPAGASPPRQSEPSCSPERPPRQGSAADGEARSPRDPHWSPSSAAGWRSHR